MPSPQREDPAEVADRQAALRAAEPDLLAALFAHADATSTEETPIEIKRGGVVTLRFRFRPLLESEYLDCRKRATHYTTSKAFGNVRIPDDLDTDKYRNFLIYAATVDDDRAAIWDNRQLWKKLGVPTGAYAVGRMLRAGEKEALIAKLDEISGYGTSDVSPELTSDQRREQADAELEETVGN